VHFLVLDLQEGHGRLQLCLLRLQRRNLEKNAINVFNVVAAIFNVVNVFNVANVFNVVYVLTGCFKIGLLYDNPHLHLSRFVIILITRRGKKLHATLVILYYQMTCETNYYKKILVTMSTTILLCN
jgi:hypothetical protein